MSKRIYLDYAATTPVDPQVLQKMLPYFTTEFGNPSSVHTLGQTALEAVDLAREQVAEFLNASVGEVVFTSGATESNNLAVKGVLRSYFSNNQTKPHLIISAIEHHCVLDTCKILAKEGQIELTLLPVYKNGVVKLADVEKSVKPNTILVSVMYVNNEIGTVQPIQAIGKLLKKINQERLAKTAWQIVFHTDATQAINYFDCNVQKLGVDLLSLSAHKIYGPKGVGALYVKKGITIKRIQDGGDQELKLRAGTLNTPGIVGLGKAIAQIKSEKSKVKSIEKLRDYLIKRVLKEIPQSYLNGDKLKRSPNNANFRFDNVEGEGLILSLDLAGFALSTGSACSSGALDPSHVLLALGLKHEQAHGSLRVTLGKHTTKADSDRFIKELKAVVARLRKISGSVLKEFK